MFLNILLHYYRDYFTKCLYLLLTNKISVRYLYDFKKCDKNINNLKLIKKQNKFIFYLSYNFIYKICSKIFLLNPCLIKYFLIMSVHKNDIGFTTFRDSLDFYFFFSSSLVLDNKNLSNALKCDSIKIFFEKYYSVFFSTCLNPSANIA